MSAIVKSQAELDAALEGLGDDYGVIEIRSPRGDWLSVRDSKNARVEAWGSSRVVAWGSSSVEAWGSSSVVARDSSSVEAWDSSRVEAWGSSSVVARGSSSVVAWESSSVEAWDSSSVVAWGSSSVVARGSSSVEASGSSSVEASGSSSVVASGSSSVEASPYVAVHLHSAHATVKGGVLIDVTQVDREAVTWLDYHGVKVTDDKAVLYKAVSDDWSTGRGFIYKPGETLTAPDWRDTDECGYGLHFGPTPRHAKDCHYSATRFVAVEVDAATLRPISGGGTAKAKAQSCRVLHEVDIRGERVAS